MVGVPRSKGCQTCLRRHVKCNEERPICGPCKKSGHRCQGYDRELTFLNQIVQRDPGSSSGQGRIVHQIQPKSDEGSVSDKVTLASEHLEISCPRELDLSAFEDKFMLTCLFTHYVHGNFGSPWLDLASAGNMGLTSRTASFAVAAEFFSQWHAQPKFLVDAVELYGDSLRLMRTELADKNSSPERFIMPIMVMIMYDFLTWQKGLSCDHFEGLSRVVQLCGPRRFQDEPYRSAFETAREILILKSLHYRKRCFFEQQDWKIVPWAQVPSKKTPANHLLDMLADVPGLIEEADLAANSKDALEISTVQQKILLQLSILYQWRWRWEARNASTVSEVAPDDPEATTIFATKLQYKNHVQVNEVGLYNTIQMWLLRLLAETGGMDLHETRIFLSEQSKRSRIERTKHISVLLLPGETTLLFEIATEILRSLEYQLQSFYNSRDSILAWVLPMGLAHQVFMMEGLDPAWNAHSTVMLERAPFSFRHACQFIAKSVRLIRG